MKLIKILLIILTFLIVLNSAAAIRYVNYEFKQGIISNSQLSLTGNSVNGVDVIGFVCGDAACNTITDVLWNGAVLNSGTSSSIQLTYPETAPAYSWGVYYFKQGYIPVESNPTWWGTNLNDPQGPYDVILAKKDICRAPIDSLNVANEVQPNIPLVINVGAGLDAATHSAIQSAGPLAYIPPGFQDYYSVKTNISLKIYDSLNNTVEEQTQIIDIPYSGAISTNFSWTPAVPGNYIAAVSTEVIDGKCLSSQQQSTSKGFHVISEDPRNICYTLLNGVYISDQFPLENETITISGNKISNYADNNYVLTPVPTNLSLSFVDQTGSLIGNRSISLPANINSVDPELFDINFTLNGVGAYSLVIQGIAQSSLCNNITNLDEIIRLDFNVYPNPNNTMNNPPVITGIPDLTIDENQVPPANWIDLWQYASDIESSGAELQFSIVTQSNPGLINCQIDNNRYVNCILAPNSFGFSDITIQVSDSQYTDRDSFRVIVNRLTQNPVIGNIPNVYFDEDSSAQLGLDNYVTDPDNNLTELSWSYSGNNHVHIAIDSSNIATFTADYNWFGTETIVFTVTDPDNNTDSDNVIVTVRDLDDSPKINLSTVYFNEEGTLILNLNNYVTDPDNTLTELSWSYSGNNHVHIAIDSSNIATFTADYNWFGTETIVFTVTDPDSNSDSINLIVTVGEVNDAPIISPIGDFKLGVREEIKINLNDYVTDVDDNINYLTWSYRASKNLEVSIDKNNIATIKSKTSLGTFSVIFTVKDSAGLINSVKINIQVSYIQKKSDLMFDTVKIDNEFVRPGQDLVININLRNRGYLDFDEVKISALVYDLGIISSATSFDLDERDTIHKKIYLTIPEDTLRGIYDIRIVVSNDGVRRVVNREFFVI